jgi:hypothetical protein
MAGLKKKARRLFRPQEAEQVAADKQACLTALQSPYIEDKSGPRNAYRRLEKMEVEHGVPDLTPEQRDQAHKQIKLLEEQIQVGMLSSEEMRRNPPGAVDQNVWWEKANKARVNQWKNLQSALHKGMAWDQMVDLLSIERIRPRHSRLPMQGAQIPELRAFSFPSDAYKANYDGIFEPKKAEPESALDEFEAEPEDIFAETAAVEVEAPPEPSSVKARIAAARGK